MSRHKTTAKSDMLVFRRRPGFSSSIFALFCRAAEKIISEKSAKSASAKTR
jgi:hypothetical protein